MSLTTDNASVNDVIVEVVARCLLARYNIPFTPDMHIRCIAHVVNLVVQAILHVAGEADNPDDVDWYELNKDCPLHYDVNNDEDQQALESDELRTSDSNANALDEGESQETLKDAVAAMKTESPLKRVKLPICLLFLLWAYASSLQLRFIVNKIASSPQRRRRFRNLAKAKYREERLRKLMVIRDVRTRWNFTHAMIRRGSLLQDVSLIFH
jgi:heme exporter protein D